MKISWLKILHHCTRTMNILKRRGKIELKLFGFIARDDFPFGPLQLQIYLTGYETDAVSVSSATSHCLTAIIRQEKVRSTLSSSGIFLGRTRVNART